MTVEEAWAAYDEGGDDCLHRHPRGCTCNRDERRAAVEAAIRLSERRAGKELVEVLRAALVEAADSLDYASRHADAWTLVAMAKARDKALSAAALAAVERGGQ